MSNTDPASIDSRIANGWFVQTDHVSVARRISEYKAVTTALKAEWPTSVMPVAPNVTVSKPTGRTRSTAYKGRYQDIKPTERKALNRLSGIVRNENVWTF